MWTELMRRMVTTIHLLRYKKNLLTIWVKQAQAKILFFSEIQVGNEDHDPDCFSKKPLNKELTFCDCHFQAKTCVQPRAGFLSF